MANRGLLTYNLSHLLRTAFIVILQTAVSLAGCKEPFGMQNGLIPDVAINASSQLSSNRGAQNGRLGNSKSWTAANKNTIQWLQVDFGRIVEITQIATQGREGAKEWVKEYYLQYSNNESQFVTYENHKLFKGNKDDNNRKVNTIDPLITARFIRINPQSWQKRISLRAEFYGCREGCLRSLGMEDKRIADLALSASTIYNNNDRYSAQRSRLNLIGSAWSPQNGEKTQWLQVDFSRKVSIVQVATQGEDGDSYWVTSYSLSYNAEGQNFVKYENDHVFEGNWDQNTIVINVLRPPITAFKVRIHPRTSYRFPALRAEFYGCRKVSQGNVNATAVSPESTIVEWQITRNRQDNSLPCGFTVGHRESTNELSSFTKNTVETSTTQFVIDGLLAYTSYEIRVEAINGVCSGTFSSSVKVITQEKAPTAPPVDVKMLSVTSSIATISWMAPERRKRNGKLLTYSIKAWELSGSSNVTRVPPALGISVHNDSSARQKGVIQGLKEDTRYQLVIIASNGVGSSPPSSEIGFTTKKAPTTVTPGQSTTVVIEDNMETTNKVNYPTSVATEAGNNETPEQESNNAVSDGGVRRRVRYPTTVPTEAANNERLQQENINAVSDGAVVAISASAALLFICIIVAVYIFQRCRKNAENKVMNKSYESPLYDNGTIPIHTRNPPSKENDETYMVPVDNYKNQQQVCIISNAEHSEETRKQTQSNNEQTNKPDEEIYTYAICDVMVGCKTNQTKNSNQEEYAQHNPIYESTEDVETNSQQQNKINPENIQGNPIYSSTSESTPFPAPLIRTTIEKPFNTKGVFQYGFSSPKKPNEKVSSVLTEPDYAILKENQHGPDRNRAHHQDYDVLRKCKSKAGKTIDFQEKGQSNYDVIWDSSAPNTAPADAAEVYDKLWPAEASYVISSDNSKNGCHDNIYDTAGKSIA